MSIWPADRSARLVALRAEGRSWTEIGRAMGITVESARKRWGRIHAQAPGSRRRGRPPGSALSPDATPLSPNLGDSSTPRFANHSLHLRLIAQALIERRAA